MSTDQNTRPTFVCYMRLKRYVAAYMQCVYGGAPLLFPSVHPVSLIIERSMVIDNDEQNIPMRCLTENQWDIVREQAENKGMHGGMANLFAQEFAIKGNTKLLENWNTESTAFFQVCLPAKGIRRGGYVMAGRNTRVSDGAMTEIREQMSREFWVELIKFVNDERLRAGDADRKLKLEHIFENFCTLYEIPIQEIETLQRKYRVELQNIKREIEQRREKINPGAVDFLHEGKPIYAQKEEKRTYQDVAVMNLREDPGQARGE